jgi:hypothetical protein
MSVELSRTVMSPKQQELFSHVSNCGDMVLGIGPKGVSANLVGRFSVRKHDDHQGKQDLILDCDDGTCHVHIDWSRVKRVAISDHSGEGVLSFFDGDERLFNLYRMDGPFPADVEKLAGDLF